MSLSATIAADIAAFRAGTPAAPPVLRAEDIEVTTDAMGRDIIVIPDAVAVELSTQVDKGWREFRGSDDGESRFFAPGTWAHDTTDLIMRTYAASPIPAPREGRDADRDRHFWTSGRRRAADWGQGAGAFFVVGRTAWDAEARWWRFDVRSLAHKALHPKAFPNRVTETASGRVGYRWQG